MRYINPIIIIIIIILRNGGSRIYWGHKFLERKIGGHKIVDDQNVGESHDDHRYSVFILFKKTDSNTILAYLGGKVCRDGGGS